MEEKTAADRLVNLPIEIKIGMRGKERTLKLSEPPMLVLLTLMDEQTDKLVDAYINNREFFDGIIASGDKKNLPIAELRKYLIPIFKEICNVIEVFDEDTTDESRARISDIIGFEQFMELLPQVLSIINIEEVKRNFFKVLEAVGIKLKVTPESELPLSLLSSEEDKNIMP